MSIEELKNCNAQRLFKGDKRVFFAYYQGNPVFVTFLRLIPEYHVLTCSLTSADENVEANTEWIVS